MSIHPMALMRRRSLVATEAAAWTDITSRHPSLRKSQVVPAHTAGAWRWQFKGAQPANRAPAPSNRTPRASGKGGSVATNNAPAPAPKKPRRANPMVKKLKDTIAKQKQARAAQTKKHKAELNRRPIAEAVGAGAGGYGTGRLAAKKAREQAAKNAEAKAKTGEDPKGLAKTMATPAGAASVIAGGAGLVVLGGWNMLGNGLVRQVAAGLTMGAIGAAAALKGVEDDAEAAKKATGGGGGEGQQQQPLKGAPRGGRLADLVTQRDAANAVHMRETRAGVFEMEAGAF